MRHVTNVLKRVLRHVDETRITMGIEVGDAKRLSCLVRSYRESGRRDDPGGLLTTTTEGTEGLRFRLDKEEYTGGAKVLRQNLLDLFTKDVAPYSPPAAAAPRTGLYRRSRRVPCPTTGWSSSNLRA